MATQRRLAQLVTAVQANMASDAPAVGEFDSCAPSASSHPTPPLSAAVVRAGALAQARRQPAARPRALRLLPGQGGPRHRRLHRHRPHDRRGPRAAPPRPPSRAGCRRQLAVLWPPDATVSAPRRSTARRSTSPPASSTPARPRPPSSTPSPPAPARSSASRPTSARKRAARPPPTSSPSARASCTSSSITPARRGAATSTSTPTPPGPASWTSTSAASST